MTTALVRAWPQNHSFSRAAVLKILAAEGLQAFPWRNEPDDYYPVHEHAYDKVIYVLSGSITFGLPAENRRLTLQAGDRLDLPSGTLHDAVVGPMGVACLEAHRLTNQR